MLELPEPFESRRSVRLAGGVVLLLLAGSMIGLKGLRALLYLAPLLVALFALRPKAGARRLEVRDGRLLVTPPDGTSPDAFRLQALQLVWEGERLLVHDGGVPVLVARGRVARIASAWLASRQAEL